MDVRRFINPLLLAYLVASGYTVLGVLEGREPVVAEVEESEASEDVTQGSSPAEDRREEPGRTSG